MALTKVQKEEILQNLVEKIKEAKSVVFSDFQGLSVEDLKELRAQMRESDVTYQIAKKTLIRLAAKELGYEEIPAELLEGPVAIAFSMGDEIAAARLIHKFGKKNENLKLRGSLFEGKVMSIEETKQLALLPGKEELLAKLVYLIKSPISGFHGVLSGTISGFVRTLSAIKEKQEQTA